MFPGNRNRRLYSRIAAFLVVLVAATPGLAFAGEWRGNVDADAWWFFHDASDPRQSNGNLSLAFEPEYFHDWDDGDQRFVFAPFLRLDQRDDERTHADIRELYWRKSFESAELLVGFGKVFWGVTELRHLVDIINQTDLVENLDGEQKLGQPMVQLTLLRDWGTLDFFAMPYFRERTFTGPDGRPRPPLYVDTDNPVYESSAEQTHFDYAARWSHYFGEFDVGLAFFSGTSREPRLLPGLNSQGEPVLIPNYDLIDQLSLDAQATLGSWLLKLEAIGRDTPQETFFAATGGFEYTLVGIFDTAIDLGLLAEYLYDDSSDPFLVTPFDDDIFLGTRLAFNDTQSTELLVGFSQDLNNDSIFFNVEGSRRIGQSWKAGLQVRIFNNDEPTDAFFAFRNEDYAEFKISKYF